MTDNTNHPNDPTDSTPESRWDHIRHSEEATPWADPTPDVFAAPPSPPMPSIPTPSAAIPPPAAPAADVTPPPAANLLPPEPSIPIYGSMPPADPTQPPADPTQQTPMPVLSVPAPPTVSVPTVPPPAPAVAPPVLSGTYGATEAIAPDVQSSGGGRTTWVIAVLGALALLVGGGAFALSALGASGGGETPEDAVDQMIAAVNNEDFITLGELLEPSERRTIVEPALTDILPELERLGIFSDDLDMGDVDGVDFQLTDVEYRIETIPGNDDLAHVFFTGGEGRTIVTADDLPFGDAIRARFGDELEDSDESDSVEPTDDDVPLVLVERNGRWYFSMWFTAGETARLRADKAMPSVNQQPLVRGSDSPEAAVEQLFLEFADFDLEAVIGTLDPEEAAALYRYSPLFLDEAQDVLDDAERELHDMGVDWTLADMDFDVDTDGDDAVVTLRGFTFTLDVEDEFESKLVWTRESITLEAAGDIDGEFGELNVVITPDLWTLDAEAENDSVEGEVTIDRDDRSFTVNGAVNGDSFSGTFTVDEDGQCSRYEFSFPAEDVNESGCLEDEIEAESGEAEADFLSGYLVNWFDDLPTEFSGPEIIVHKTDGEWFVSPMGTIMHAVVGGLEDLDEDLFNSWLDFLESENDVFDLESVIEGSIDLANIDGSSDSAFDPIPDSGIVDAPVIIDDFPSTELAEETFFIQPDSQPSVYNDVVDADELHVYSVNVTSGQLVGLTLYGSDVVARGIDDPYLVVEGPQSQFESNDDFDGFNSALQFEARETGEFMISVSDLSYGSGAYELTIQVVDADTTLDIADGACCLGGGIGEPPIDQFPDTAQVGEISNLTFTGSPGAFAGYLEAGEYDIVGLQGVEPGQSVTITLQAEDQETFDFDAYLIVRNPITAEIISENDDAFLDGLGQYDSQVIVSGSSAYSIEVRTLADFGFGGYTLTVEPTG